MEPQPLTLEAIREMTKAALSRKEAASALDIDPRTLDKGIDNGTIPSVTIGRRVLIPRLPFLALFGADRAAA